MTDTFQSSVVQLTAPDGDRQSQWSLGRLIRTLALSLALGAAVYSPAQQGRDAHTETLNAEVENTGAPVEIDGRPVLMVYARIGGFTAKERAEAIQQRIISLSKNRSVPVESIHAESRASWTEILAGNERIMGITEEDAEAAERDRTQLAAEYTEIIRQVVTQYR